MSTKTIRQELYEEFCQIPFNGEGEIRVLLKGFVHFEELTWIVEGLAQAINDKQRVLLIIETDNLQRACSYIFENQLHKKVKCLAYAQYTQKESISYTIWFRDTASALAFSAWDIMPVASTLVKGGILRVVQNREAGEALAKAFGRRFYFLKAQMVVGDICTVLLEKKQSIEPTTPVRVLAPIVEALFDEQNNETGEVFAKEALVLKKPPFLDSVLWYTVESKERKALSSKTSVDGTRASKRINSVEEPFHSLYTALANSLPINMKMGNPEDGTSHVVQSGLMEKKIRTVSNEGEVRKEVIKNTLSYTLNVLEADGTLRTM